ncbi:MAG TPA: FAD-binding oxidoreductase [Mycobacteriales bacterium]|nr:FAD-binding oxidoreductase [Mycobacteriales bacterium]
MIDQSTSPPRTDRRRFLRIAGAATVVGVAAACDSGNDNTPAPTSSAPGSSSSAPTTPPATTPPTTTPAPTTPSPSPTTPQVRPADYTALGKGLKGELIQPGSSSYPTAKQIFNPRFDSISPTAVIQCAGPEDVAEAVRFVAKFQLPVALRSGGHCYAGWSVGHGLVIDTGPMSQVRASGGSATAQAGARLIDVYSTLANAGVGIPGGSCPSVGITGLALGGGIGVVDRAWGLTCDNVTAVEIVTADGQVHTCTARHDADLFWACRGGGGGNFGVVTGLTFKTRPTQPLATWYLSWPWSAAPAILAAWQKWLPGAPNELWGSVHLASAPGSATPSVSVVGTFLGADTTALNKQLDGLVAAVGSEPGSRSAAPHEFLQTMLTEAGCASKSLEECHLAPTGSIERQAYAASSDWINTPMSAAGNQTLIAAVQKRHDTPNAPDVAVQLDAAGGAINRVAPNATAFVHRRAICSVQYIANWYTASPPADVTAWPHATRTAMQRYVSGEAYQNYVDPAIRDWQRAYYGANYAKLQQVKAKYDPHNVFHHAQSVTAR